MKKNRKLYCMRAPSTKYQKTFDLLVNTPNSEINIIYTSYGIKSTKIVHNNYKYMTRTW